MLWSASTPSVMEGTMTHHGRGTCYLLIELEGHGPTAQHLAHAGTRRVQAPGSAHADSVWRPLCPPRAWGLTSGVGFEDGEGVTVRLKGERNLHSFP